MKLVPLFDKVVLKQLVAEETTASGIVLPGAAKEKPQQAEVIAVGPGGVVDGKEVTMQVKAGDKVIYSKYSGTEVELEKQPKNMSKLWIIVFFSCRFHWLKRVIRRGVGKCKNSWNKRKRKKGTTFKKKRKKL